MAGIAGPMASPGPRLGRTTAPQARGIPGPAAFVLPRRLRTPFPGQTPHSRRGATLGRGVSRAMRCLPFLHGGATSGTGREFLTSERRRGTSGCRGHDHCRMAQVLPVGVVRPSPIELVRVRDAFAGTRGLRNSAHFHRVRTGVYAARPAWDALRPWERYLARVHAYALVNSDAVFAYESAAALLGLPVFGEPALIHVYALARTRSRRFGDVFVHSCVAVPETVTLGAHTMTTPATTTADLMRVLPPPFGLAVGDAAVSRVQGGMLAVADLEAAAAALPNTRGRALRNLLLPMVDARAESPGESVSRAVIVWSGFEPPDLQRVFVTDGITDRTDFWWESAKAIAESDGYGKYVRATAEETLEGVLAEKRREDRLRRHCREFGRWDWAACMAVAPVIGELERLGVPRVAAPRSRLLATMRANPRSLPRTPAVPRTPVVPSAPAAGTPAARR